jgi:hypothetical protein
MKKSLILGGLLAVLAIGFVSFDKKKEKSIAGTYDLASSQYYFDGQKLDYQSPVIGICDSAAVKPVYMYNYDVSWTVNEDGTGDYLEYDGYVPQIIGEGGYGDYLEFEIDDCSDIPDWPGFDESDLEQFDED